jgi:RNA polymerase sigma-70 factor, ECF subfamily
MEPASDAELLERYRLGDVSAFDEIVDRYERRVWAVALRMVGHAEDARDVSQEVFVSAIRALRTFREESQLSTWFHRVTVNASLDLLRKRKRADARPLEEVQEQASDSPGPEAHAVGATRAAEVQKALTRLSEEHRAVLVLHDLQDLDYGEVSAALGIPLGTVKSRIHRARVEMARMLGHLREGMTEPTEGGTPLREQP